MKNLKIYFLALLFIAGTIQLSAQSEEESTGMLGDNFSLEGALEVLKNHHLLQTLKKNLIRKKIL